MKKIDYDTLIGFCTKDDFRIALHYPCLKQGYWCASDGAILVMAHESVCDDNIPINDETLEKFKNIFNIFNPSLFKPEYIVKLEELDRALNEVPKVKVYDERIIETEYEECEACGGSGEMEDEVDFRGNLYTYSCECPVCHGYGRVPVSEEYDPDEDIPEEFVDREKYWTGKMEIEYKADVRIGDFKYRAEYINKVKTLMQEIGTNRAMVCFTESNFIVFNFNSVYIVVCNWLNDKKDIPTIKIEKLN